jgi:hypothetical protein
MPFPQLDPRRLKLRPLSQRKHEVDCSCLISPETAGATFPDLRLKDLASAILRAREQNRSVIFFCGAHVLRQGCGPLLIDLMENGVLTHLALNGAGAIHDFEMALIGSTCESVARYISEGQFGLWEETGRINEAVSSGVKEGLGFGESVAG